MTDWKADELNAIALAPELEIATPRRDEALRDPVTIWVVGVGDGLFVRSVRGSAGSWYQGSQRRHEGRIEAGGIERDVELADADHSLDDKIDAAYKEKYGYPSSSVDNITSAEARATTLRLIPEAST